MFKWNAKYKKMVFLSFTVTPPAKVIQLETDTDTDIEFVEDIGE